MNTQMGLLAKKIGMTEYYLEDGTRVPVTVLQVGGNVVTAHRTVERNGYAALQLGFGDKAESRCNKPDAGQFKKANVAPKYFVAEFRVSEKTLAAHEVGAEVSAEVFSAGQLVDIAGTSKGKGYQGVMKRHNMAGEKASHGQHEFFRHGGSIGCRKTPGRVFKNKRMSGRMGNERVTVQNLKVERVLADKGVILVRGPIPGANDGYVTIRHAVKSPAPAGK
jgi:large subunit ribosomal protein L3